MAELEAMDIETLIVRWNATLLGKPLSNQQLEDVKQTLTKKDEPYKEGGDKTLEQALRNQVLEYFQRLVTLQTLDTDTMDLKELLIMEAEAISKLSMAMGVGSKQDIVKRVEDRMNRLESYEGAWVDETCEEYLRKEIKSFFAELWKSIVASKNMDVKAVTLETLKEYLENSFPAEQVAEYIKSEEQKWEKDLNIYRTDMALDITELEFKNLLAYFNYLPTSTFLKDFRAKQDMKDQAKEEEHKTKPIIFGSQHIEETIYKYLTQCNIITRDEKITMGNIGEINQRILKKEKEELDQDSSRTPVVSKLSVGAVGNEYSEEEIVLNGIQYFPNLKNICIGTKNIYRSGILEAELVKKYPHAQEGHIYENTYDKIGMYQLKDLEPLSQMKQLQELEIYHTKVSSLEPLSDLTNLEKLIIYDSDVISCKDLAKLTNLKHLTIACSPLVSLDGIEHLTNLEVLEVWDTKITSIDPIKHLTNLKVLNLGGESRYGVSPAMIEYPSQNPVFRKYNMQGVSDLTPLENLINIEYLDLSHNQIENLMPLRNLIKLPNKNEKLHLSHNKIKSLEGLPQGEWKMILADHNEIETLNSNIQSKYWDLGYNNLTSKALMTLRESANKTPIVQLTLKNNQICDLSFLNKNMVCISGKQEGNTYYSWLDVSYNQIQNIEPLVDNMEIEDDGLIYEKLDLSHNQISTLSGLKVQAAVFDVSYNRLEELDIAKGSKILYKFNCRNNQISSLDVFKENIQFENGLYGFMLPVYNFDCSNNQIKDITPIMQQNVSFHVLAFGGNQLSTIPKVPIHNIRYSIVYFIEQLGDVVEMIWNHGQRFEPYGFAPIKYIIDGTENQHIVLEEQKLQKNEECNVEKFFNVSSIENNLMGNLYEFVKNEDENQSPQIMVEQSEYGKCELIYNEQTGELSAKISDIKKSYRQKIRLTYQYRTDESAKHSYLFDGTKFGWDFEIPITLVDENGKEITQGDLELKAIDKQTKEGVAGAKIHILKQGETTPILTGTTDHTGNFVQDVVKTKSGSEEQALIELESGTYEYIEAEAPQGYQPTTEKGSFTIQNGEKTTVILEKEKIVSSVDKDKADKEEPPTTEEKNPVPDPKETPEEVPLEDNSVPTLQLDYGKEWTNQDIVVKITAKDEVRLKHLVLPDGKEQPVDVAKPKHMEYEYTVKESGNYTFTAVNKQDKTASETMTAKIDKVKPIGKVIEKNDEYHITATDDASGVSHMIDPDGKRIDWSKYYETSGFDTKKAGMYTIYDRAGNKTELDVKDTIPPTLTLTYQKGWVKGKANIGIVAKDEKEIGYLELPTGKQIKPNDSNKKEITYQYVVQESGIYKFIAVDQGGNQTVETATIQIDNIAPKVTIQQGQKQTFLYAVDQESGVDYVITPSKKKIQWKKEYETTGIPIHEYGTYIVYDKVGNEGYGQLQPEEKNEEHERPATKEVTREPEEENQSNKEEPEVTTSSNIPEMPKQKPSLGYLYRKLGGDLERIEIPEEQYKLLTLGVRVSGEDIGREDIQTVYMDKKGNLIIIGTDGEQYETFVPKTGDNIFTYRILSFGGGLILFLFWRRNRKKILK